MSADLDLPLVPSADQIRRREFASVRRGYDPDQVRDYLAQVANQVESMERELGEARLAAEAPPATPAVSPAAAPVEEAAPPREPTKDDAYEKLSRRIANLIAAADHEAEKLLAEAREEAAVMLDAARTEADRITVDAQSRAEAARQRGSEFLEKAKAESERTLAGLSDRRTRMIDQLQDMQTRLLGVAKELEVAIERPAGKGDIETATARAQPSTSSPADSPSDAGGASPDDAPSEEVWVSDEADEVGELPHLELDLQGLDDEDS